MRIGFSIIIGGSFILAASGFWLLQNTYNPQNEPASLQLSIQQQQGLALVTSYCSDCHAVGTTGDSLHPPAPRFRELYERFDVRFLEEALVEGLVAHPDMPEFEFDADQAMAIIEYLEILQTE